MKPKPDPLASVEAGSAQEALDQFKALFPGLMAECPDDIADWETSYETQTMD